MEYHYSAIKNIFKASLEYIDENDDIQVVDFATCNQNSVKIFKSDSSKYIAYRNVIGDPIGTAPYIEFFTEPLTKFIFSNEEEFDKLRAQIEQAGWLTFDLS